MKLKEIFDQLSYGELSQVSLGGGKSGEIIEPDFPKVAASVSLGLTSLYTRFPLKESTYVLTLVPGTTTYNLQYLKDILKIERVYDAAGNELSLNVRDDPYSARTIGLKTLVLPSTLTGSTVKVVYRANHRVLTEDDWQEPENCEIEIEPAFLQALLYFVASRVMNPTGFSGGNGFHEGNNYRTLFENECAMLEQMNVRVDEIGVNTRFKNAGWV